MLQVCRSIGDAYLKKQEFNREPLYAKFRLREPFNKPILSSEPSICVQPIHPHDQFLIFASDGLWEHLTNQEAVDIVQSNPRSVSFLLPCESSNLPDQNNAIVLAIFYYNCTCHSSALLQISFFVNIFQTQN
jgi:serine/threonine protein phosphatase PrpC